MKSSLAIELIFFGIILGFLGVFADKIAPEVSPHVRLIGIFGGALIFIWGVAGFAGLVRHLWAVLTLAVVTFLLIKEIIFAWRQSEGGQRIGVLLLGLVSMFSVVLIGMLLAAAKRQNDDSAPAERRPHGPVA